MYDERGAGPDGAGQGGSSTRTTCSTPASSSTRRRSTPTSGWPRRWPPARSGLRLRHDRGDLADAVHRCTGVGKCLADNTGSGGVMCPSYQATREEKDSTRGRARVLQDAVTGRLPGAGTRRALERGARPLPGLQGLRPRLPDRRRHGDLQGRVAAPEVRRQAPAAHPLHAGAAAAAARRRCRPRLGERSALRLPRRWPAAFAGVDPRRSLPLPAPRPVSSARAGTSDRAGRPTSCCGSTRSPTGSRPRSPTRRSRCSRPPARPGAGRRARPTSAAA